MLRNLEHPTRAAQRIAQEQLGVELKEVRLEHIESFRGDDGSWHMSFHHLDEFPSAPMITPGPGVREVQWFPLGALPDRDDVAHHGWALSVLGKMKLTAR